jgi:hypothetical protein
MFGFSVKVLKEEEKRNKNISKNLLFFFLPQFGALREGAKLGWIWGGHVGLCVFSVVERFNNVFLLWR